MEIATDSNHRRNQRIWITAPTDIMNDTNIKKPPMALAEAFIRSSVASLQQSLASIVEKLGKEHIVILSKLDNKKGILKKLEDNEDMIPRSAQLEFKLTGSKCNE
jgi:hypothetical protein